MVSDNGNVGFSVVPVSLKLCTTFHKVEKKTGLGKVTTYFDNFAKRVHPLHVHSYFLLVSNSPLPGDRIVNRRRCPESPHCR